MSHDILVEQDETLVLSARRSLIDDINASKFYAIICDESSDIRKLNSYLFLFAIALYIGPMQYEHSNNGWYGI
jgi:hypothetical protein